MNENIALYLKPATRAAVSRMLNARGEARALFTALENVLEEALQAWLVKAACDDPQAAQAAARGYQWKSLFLPEGTCVRFEYKRRTWHAEVRGDHIIYEGKAYSPRQLLLHVTGTVRNAWRELWIRAPGDFRWHLANTRRHILRRTPRGRHSRGIDTAGVTAVQAIAIPEPAPQADAGTSAQSPQRPSAHRLAQRRPDDYPPAAPRPTDALAAGARPAVAHAANARPVDARPADPGPHHVPVENSGRLAALRAILYRDDLVRADQADLACPRGGGGRGRAGRAGPRDRRLCG